MIKNDRRQQHSGNGDLPSPANGYAIVPTVMENGGGDLPSLGRGDTPGPAMEENGVDGENESIQNGEEEAPHPHARKGITRRKDAYNVDFS
jgi:hypothetical protein